MKYTGIYIHAPFCVSKCGYCDFYSISKKNPRIKGFTPDSSIEKIINIYNEKLIHEIINFSEKTAAETIYFGGGTPVLLGGKAIEKTISVVREHFGFKNNGIEITTEANPDLIDGGILDILISAGINRISFGMQSGVDSELRILNRTHDKNKIFSAVKSARRAGFNNISVDIMLGIPFQTLESLSETLDCVEQISPEHISVYMLKVEKGTPFAEKNLISSCPDDDTVCEMYHYAAERLERKGLKQYEISNFAVPGYECLHNLKYWRCEEYLGFGVSSHSYFNGKRYAHGRDLYKYIENPLGDIYYTDNNAGSFDEYAMLRLRLNEGLDVRTAQKLFDIKLDDFIEMAKYFSHRHLVKLEDETVSLTREGFLVSNKIIGDLLDTV